jgi:hypothetical protein
VGPGQQVEEVVRVQTLGMSANPMLLMANGFMGNVLGS